MWCGLESILTLNFLILTTWRIQAESSAVSQSALQLRCPKTYRTTQRVKIFMRKMDVSFVCIDVWRNEIVFRSKHFIYTSCITIALSIAIQPLRSDNHFTLTSYVTTALSSYTTTALSSYTTNAVSTYSTNAFSNYKNIALFNYKTTALSTYTNTVLSSYTNTVLSSYITTDLSKAT